MSDRPDPMTHEDEWRAIEREARASALTMLERDENTPLVFGAHIAWVDGMHGRTDDLSAIHRVGYPEKGKPMTTCGLEIPAPIRWFTLSPALLRTMDSCRFCEAEHQRLVRSHDAAA